MEKLTESELKEIVQKVLNRTMGEVAVAASNPVSQNDKKSEGVSGGVKRKVAIGADHGGFEMKENLKKYLSESNYEVIDCGTYSKDAVDYPDLAQDVALKVASGEAWRGVVIDGAGIGSCMAANKVKGVLAAMCYDHASAVNSREHNNANVLTLGASLIGMSLARQILETWLKTEFGGGRHERRVNKIFAIEQK